MGRPPWQLWAAAVAVTTAGALVGVVVAIGALATAPMTALVSALAAFGFGVLLPRAWARFAPLWALFCDDRKCWAVSDESMILVDARGAAVEVDLERIVALEIDEQEPRLRIDGDQQGVVYAALFDVFDEEGASAEAFFDALEPRLRARMPGAQIVRHADLPLS